MRFSYHDAGTSLHKKKPYVGTVTLHLVPRKNDLLRYYLTKKHESNVAAVKESTKVTQFLRLRLLNMQSFLTTDEKLIICVLP